MKAESRVKGTDPKMVVNEVLKAIPVPRVK